MQSAKNPQGIPAASVSSTDSVRRIFFDEVEWNGKVDIPVICDLRDIDGFVLDDGQHGFVLDSGAPNKTVHYSTEYRTVLVQADIVDAMEFQDYFEKDHLYVYTAG